MHASAHYTALSRIPSSLPCMQVLITALLRIPSSLPCMQVLITALSRIPSSPPLLAPGALRALQRAALHDQALHARPDADRAGVVARARPPLFRRAPRAGGGRRAPCGRGGRWRARGEPSRCRGRAAASGRVWREQACSDCKGARDARSTVVATRAEEETLIVLVAGAEAGGVNRLVPCCSTYINDLTSSEKSQVVRRCPATRARALPLQTRAPRRTLPPSAQTSVYTPLEARP